VFDGVLSIGGGYGTPVSVGAAGIVLGRGDKNETLMIEGCHAKLDMVVENPNYLQQPAAAAGIFAEWHYKENRDPDPDKSPGRNLIISDCLAEGKITVKDNGVMASGIAVGGPRHPGTDESDQTVDISGCVAAVSIVFDITGSGNSSKAAGIWANDLGRNTTAGAIATLRENLFMGKTDDTSGSAIWYARDEHVTHAAIYTVHEQPANPPASGSNGQTAEGDSDAARLDWFYNTFLSKRKTGWSTVSNAGGTATVGYALASAGKRLPAQRIYVSDYYDSGTIQEFIDKLWVLRGGKLVPLWGAADGHNRIGNDAKDPNAAVDFHMPAGVKTFVFCMKAPKIDIRKGDDPKIGSAYPNIVKLIPKDNILIPADDKGNYKFDWPGVTDDDLVRVKAKDTKACLNPVKMTEAANYPIPLEGVTFTLYKRPGVIYSDFTNVDYKKWEYVPSLKPSGYQGLAPNDMPEILPGSYVLEETSAPEHYGNNMGQWYIVFSGSADTRAPRVCTDKELKNPLNLGEETGTADGLATVVYSAQIFNERDENAPHARICAEKYNEDGSKKIDGAYAKQANGLEYFTGAVYALEKYAFDSFDSPVGGKDNAPNGYGNMILCGDPNSDPRIRNCCEIEPGYYRLIEKQAPDGYATDPTPIYISYTAAEGLKWRDPHPADRDRVSCLPGAQDLRADFAEKIENGVPTLTVKTRDTKPQYRLTLKKYDGENRNALPGVTFDLYEAGQKLQSIPSDAKGLVPIDLPQRNGVYTVREVLPPALAAVYAPAPDYTLEARNGELYVAGGPYGYNFKIVRGQRDGLLYVVLDPEHSAMPVYPPDPLYPTDFIAGGTAEEEDFIGFVCGTAGVPNHKGASAVIEGTKRVNAGAPGNVSFTFTMTQTDADGRAIAPTAIVPPAVTRGAGAFAFGPVYGLKTPGDYYFKAEEVNGGAARWTYDTAAHIVKVTVSKGSDGALKATVSYPDGGVEFKNSYTPPGSSGSSETPPTPPTTPAEPPATPAEPPAEPPANGTLPPLPTSPGNSLIPNGSGGYIELDEDGTPLGEWHYDDETGEWVFDAYPPPLSNLPQTGCNGIPAYTFPLLGASLFLLLGASLFGAGAALRRRSKTESDR
jgi:pilin isopeptide linkage protein